MCDYQSQSCCFGENSQSRPSYARCCMEDTGDSHLASQSFYSYPGSYSHEPPTYSTYPYEVESSYFSNLYQAGGGNSNHSDTGNCSCVEKQDSTELSDAYFDFLCGKNKKTNYKDTNYSDCCDQGQQVKEEDAIYCQGSFPCSESKKIVPCPTKVECEHVLSSDCRELEHGDEDPLGVGPELMEELKESMEGTLATSDRDSIYSLISMASNSKFLFDGDNMIRVQPKGSVRQLFGTNPELISRIKRFVRQKAEIKLMTGAVHSY